MAAKISYRGNTYEGRIVETRERYGEKFYTVTWNEGRIEKCLHQSHVKIATAA